MMDTFWGFGCSTRKWDSGNCLIVRTKHLITPTKLPFFQTPDNNGQNIFFSDTFFFLLNNLTKAVFSPKNQCSNEIFFPTWYYNCRWKFDAVLNRLIVFRHCNFNKLEKQLWTFGKECWLVWSGQVCIVNLVGVVHDKTSSKREGL